MDSPMNEKIWFERNIYNDAERNYYEILSKVSPTDVLYTEILYI